MVVVVVALEREQQDRYMSKLFHFSRHAKSSSLDSATGVECSTPSDDNNADKIDPSPKSSPAPASAPSPSPSPAKAQSDELTKQPSGTKSAKEEPPQPAPTKPSDADMMREKFSKLLLGEDMSGGGKGVSSALALSNAITNLAASVFGEQRRLEPMAPDRKARWRKEIDWFLSVTDYIVEFSPAQQKTKDGKVMEVMVWKQRKDLQMNIPALRKLDAMLLECLENFKGKNEFYYVKHSDEQDKEGTNRKDDKWWLPTVKVPANGLSDMSRKFIQHQKDCVNQVLKAAMAINAQVLSEMEVPESYIETLPKNGRASLGDLIYKNITVEFFDPDQFLSSMDLSSEHKILDLKNRIEASIVIWKRKMTAKDSKSSWGSGVSIEKREVFEERAETILLLLKHRYPGIAQSSLDISKIQFNRDVGQAILESYSRIIESLAYTVLSRIEDVLLADREAQGIDNKPMSFTEAEMEKLKSSDGAMTLSDFMGWDFNQGGESKEDYGDDVIEDDEKEMNKVPSINTKKTSYLETLGGQRSPTARH